MVEHGLYDLDKSADKNQGAYTISLPEYGTAFIMNNAYGNTRDIMTLVHEFGHFTPIFTAQTASCGASSNIDVAEFSLRALRYCFPVRRRDVRRRKCRGDDADTIYNMLYAIDEGCMYDEFQQ